MKQNDIITILVIVFVSLVLSFFIAGAIINTDDSKSAEVEVVQPIESGFNTPDDRIFNDEAINPTELINIGGSQSNTPFENGAQQNGQ